MNPYAFPPMPTEMRAKQADLLKQDGLHIVYAVPVKYGDAWKQKLGFTITSDVQVTFVMFLWDKTEFRVCVNDYHGNKGYVELGTFGTNPGLYSWLPNVHKNHNSKALINPLGPMQYFTCGFKFAGTDETKGYINETLLGSHNMVRLDQLDEIFVHESDRHTNDATLISIHVTGARQTVDLLFSNKIPNTRLAQNFVGSVMTILGVYKRDSAASNDKIQLDVYKRNSPDAKVRLEVDPGTIDKKDKLVQVKFGLGSVTAEGPGGKDLKPATFAGLTENCAVKVAHNFQVKRVKVESYLFKDPSYEKVVD